MKLIYLSLMLILCNNAIGSIGVSSHYAYSARSFSLSDALVADTYHTFQSFSNPSTLNQCKKINIGSSYFHMSLDRSIQTIYFSKNLPGNAGLSIAILRESVNDFMGKDSFNNPTNNISMSDYYGLLSFGLKSFGISIKMHYSSLNINETHSDRFSGNSIVVDLGWSKNLTDKFRLGVKLENILNPYLNWDVDIADGFSHSYTEEYPLIISLGSGYKMSKEHYFLFQQDISSFNDDLVYSSRFGYEYMSTENLFIRCGLKGNDDLRLGFGYIYSLKDNLPIILDYSIDLGSQKEGISHLLTWSLGL